MKPRFMNRMSTWSLAGCLLLGGIRSACGQVTSPLTVTGTTSSEIQMIKSNAPAKTWTFFASDLIFGIHGGGGPIFKIRAGAPTQSVVIDDTGRTSFTPGGTGVTPTPQRSLHVFDPDSPALRLEQTPGQNNFSQAFDLEVGNLGFSIIDVTNSNKIPLTIETGAPTDSLYVNAIGSVGLGTGFPATLLHAHQTAGAAAAETIARFDVADDAVGKLEINNVSSTNGIFHPRLRGTAASQAVALTMEGAIASDIGGNPVITFAGTKLAGGSIVNRPLVAFRNNQTVKASIAANGDMFATSFNPTSSRAVKDKIVDLESQKARAALRDLVPVEYVYKDDPTSEQRVGFIAEDVPEIVANADRKSVPIMDVVALLTRVVKDQQQTIEEQKRINDSLIERLNALEVRMRKPN